MAPIRYISDGALSAVIVDHGQPEGRAFILDMLRDLRGQPSLPAAPLSQSHPVDLEIAEYIKWRATR